jgi:hypothetical protein
VVKTTKGTKTSAQVPVSDLESGMYFATVTVDGEPRGVSRIVVE